MFGFADCASFIPCQADWLNERSSTPPVSSTMQALRACPAEAPPEAPVDDEPPPVASDFDPHAVRATDATAASARTRTVPFTIPPPHRRPRPTGMADIPSEHRRPVGHVRRVARAIQSLRAPRSQHATTLDTGS